MRLRIVLASIVWSALLDPGSLLAQGAFFRTTDGDTPAISASGVGVVRVQPDRAILFVKVTPEPRSMGSEALTEVAAKSTQLQTALEQAGLPAGDFSPWGVSVADPSAMTGMGQLQPAAIQGWRFIVRDFARLSEFLALALLNGATQVAGVIYESDPTPQQRAEATTAAFQHAHGEATALAVAAGGSLGKLLSAGTTPNYNAMNASQMLMSGMGMNGQMIPQDPSIQVGVQASWEFVPN